MSRFYIPIVKGMKQLPSFNNITDIGTYALAYIGDGNSSITSVSFPNLTTISGNYALSHSFSNCSNLTSVSFPKLATISGEYAMYYAFYYCHNLESVSFPELTTISGDNAFYWCFWANKNTKHLYFPKLTSVVTSGLNLIVRTVTGCTIHFKTGTESTISALTGYPNFGGTNTTLVFDL